MENNHEVHSETKSENANEDLLMEGSENKSSGDSNQEEEELSFQEIFENSIKDLKQGEVIPGEVIQTITDYVVFYPRQPIL